MMYVALMFVGILIGILVLTNSVVQNSTCDVLPDFDIPKLNKTSVYDSWDKFRSLTEIKIRLTELMYQDSLSISDSVEIKEIDVRLNQLLHD